MIRPIGAELLQLYGAIEDHCLSGTSFPPLQKRISINSGKAIRFQFSEACEHWDYDKNGQGKPYCMILKINSVDGRKEHFVAFESNEFWHWADVPVKDLGRWDRGLVFLVTSANGEDARGTTRREYLGKKGKCRMGFVLGIWFRLAFGEDGYLFVDGRDTREIVNDELKITSLGCATL